MLRFGHSVLLTGESAVFPAESIVTKLTLFLCAGTPVNNNLDELFNLLHFLDKDAFNDLEGLHTKYEVLTKGLVEE